MDLLLLTPQLPYPPRQGTALRNYNLLKQLARRHTIDLLTFLAPHETLPEAGPLHQLCRRIDAVPQPQRSQQQRVRDTLLSPLPDMALRLECQAMHERVRAHLDARTYDIIQVEGIEMAQYGLTGRHPHDRGRNGPRFVFDNHNCEYLLQKRNAVTDLRRFGRLPAASYSLVQWRKLVRYEAAVCRAADAVTVVSQADGEALCQIVPTLNPVVVSNGIDLSLYADLPSVGAAATPARPQNPATLVFTGKMDYRPNVDAVLWFGRDVLPLVADEEPDVRFQIVGMNPHPRLDELRKMPQVEITGAVDDVRPYINQAAVYVIPLRIGGGTRFKALEAMASRKAIVSTSLGVEGIAVEDGRELLIADDPISMAAATLQLLRETPAERAVLGDAGYEFVSKRYAWEQIVPRLEEVYATVRRDT